MNETPESAHTPLPWSVQDEDAVWCGEGDNPNAPLFRPDSTYRRWGREINRAEREANAAFIVRACNSHYQLVESLREAIEELWDRDHSSTDRIQFERDNASLFATLSQAGGASE